MSDLPEDKAPVLDWAPTSPTFDAKLSYIAHPPMADHYSLVMYSKSNDTGYIRIAADGTVLAYDYDQLARDVEESLKDKSLPTNILVAFKHLIDYVRAGEPPVPWTPPAPEVKS